MIRSGSQSLTGSLLRSDALKLESDLDDVVNLPTHLLRELLQSFRSEVSQLRAERSELQEYLKSLPRCIQPADLSTFEAESFGADFNRKASCPLIDSILPKAGLRVVDSHLEDLREVWTHVQEPFSPEDYRILESNTVTTFDELDFLIEDGRFRTLTAAEQEYRRDSPHLEFRNPGNIISGPMLFYRLFSMEFESLPKNPFEIRLRHRDNKSVARFMYPNWGNVMVHIKCKSATAKDDACELLTYVCGPSWIKDFYEDNGAVLTGVPVFGRYGYVVRGIGDSESD